MVFPSLSSILKIRSIPTSSKHLSIAAELCNKAEKNQMASTFENIARLIFIKICFISSNYSFIISAPEFQNSDIDSKLFCFQRTNNGFFMYQKFFLVTLTIHDFSFIFNIL